MTSDATLRKQTKGNPKMSKSGETTSMDKDVMAHHSVLDTGVDVDQRARADAVTIRQVNSCFDRSRFARVPAPIYANDPNWVEPLHMEVKAFINPRKHPFYKHGKGAAFIAYRGKTAVGRILVGDDPIYNELHGTNVGTFGMFESIQDEVVATELLNTAAAWVKEQGRTSIMGPIDFSTNYPLGLLVEGFDTPPRVMMNHHPTYYADLLEAWGLRKTKDLYCWWFTDPNDMITRWAKRAERIAQRSGVVVRPFRKDDFKNEVERCRSVYNAARTANWGFSRLTEAEFDHMAKQLSRLAVPELTLLAEIDDKPVGFSITMPDVNEAIQPLCGRLDHPRSAGWIAPIYLSLAACKDRENAGAGTFWKSIAAVGSASC